MAPDRRPLIVQADAPPRTPLNEEGLGLGELDCELAATEAAALGSLPPTIQ